MVRCDSLRWKHNITTQHHNTIQHHNTTLYFSIVIDSQQLTNGLIIHGHQGVPNTADFKVLCSYYTLENGIAVILVTTQHPPRGPKDFLQFWSVWIVKN